MTTNRQTRRKTVAQNRSGKITTISAAYRTHSALSLQQAAFQETVVLFKAVVAAFYGAPFPDALWNKLATELEEKRGKGTVTTWADVEKTVTEVVAEFKTLEGV
jgi:hypothetical protein